MLNVLFHWCGLDDGSGAIYLFWSGVVGDLALLGAIATAFKLVNCHASGCWRIGLHHVDGTPYKTCRHHHPTVPSGRASVTAEHIARAHRNAQNRGSGLAQ